jgi:hypothetical protein
LEKHHNKKFKCSSVSTDIPTPILTNNNDILEMKDILLVLVNEIRTLKEQVATLTHLPQISPVSLPQISTNLTHLPEILPIITPTQQYIIENKEDSLVSTNLTQVPTEKDKYIQQPTVEKDKELSVLVVSKQKKTKKPTITYIPFVDAPTNKKQLARQFTPIIIPENLKSFNEKMIYINDTYEPTTNLFSNVTEFYKTNELFEFDDDTSKIYIRKNKVEYLIGECSNKCKSKSFITELFHDFINQQTNPLFYYDGIHLFIVDEKCFFDEDLNNSVSNPIACKFLDTFNSILAYTALIYKDKQNILFDIKNTNITSKVFSDIVVKLLQCSV